ncbi:MAG TPA: DUF5134 domain-containing protein [Streptosporangiaceae bacterium]|nr:DUF5134 domain-containing protein [Streptosporangiaceae bacterium]
MAGPAWLADSFAALMLLTALYCAGRLAAARARHRPNEQDVDLVHVLMGVAMAGMLAPHALVLLPGVAQPGGTLWDGTWGLVFGAATVWFTARVARSYRATGRLRPAGSHHLPHLIMSMTMVYMLATVPRPAQPGGPAMDGSAGPAVHFPVLALILAQFMVAYVMWTADRLPALAPVRAWRPAPAAVPALALASPAAASPARASPAAASPATGSHGGASPAGSGASPARPQPASRPPLSLRLASCCNIVMGLVMAYMLIVSL